MEFIYKLCYILVFIGAINWGLVGLFKFDLVAAIARKKFGELATLNRVIYVIVLVAGIIAAIHYFS